MKSLPLSAQKSDQFRRYALGLIGCVLLPPLLLAAFVAAVDPYYLFGSPSWHGFNAVKPKYESHVLVVKPYQLRRIRPDAVSLGSSRVEVGIDPRHPGWTKGTIFNFALPSSNSMDLMLAFSHAQALGRPLKQAVVGLDFFAFNVLAAKNQGLDARVASNVVEEFANFLAAELENRGYVKASPPSKNEQLARSAWHESLYLAANPDVAKAIARNEFKSGREHYELVGRAQHRLGGTIPADWDEAGYMEAYPDVAYFTALTEFQSGYHHYLLAGRWEGRIGGFQPPDWNERDYLAANPAARIRILIGDYHSGYVHFGAEGRQLGLLGGFPATNLFDQLRLHWPVMYKATLQFAQFWRLIFSISAAADSFNTVFNQSEPATFDAKGMRIWQGHETDLRRLGGTGNVIRSSFMGGGWGPDLTSPTFKYCFTNPRTGFTAFDPYRFMLRQAYAEGTDLRLYTTPSISSLREIFVGLGLGTRYDFWLKELVKINEEEAARANRPPLQLWDFSDVNTITRETIPETGDLTPMHWYWEQSHYRKETGDLILDRIFGHNDPARPVPADFGVRLTSANIDAHITRTNENLAELKIVDPDIPKFFDVASKPHPNNHQPEAACW